MRFWCLSNTFSFRAGANIELSLTSFLIHRSPWSFPTYAKGVKHWGSLILHYSTTHPDLVKRGKATAAFWQRHSPSPQVGNKLKRGDWWSKYFLIPLLFFSRKKTQRCPGICKDSDLKRQEDQPYFCQKRLVFVPLTNIWMLSVLIKIYEGKLRNHCKNVPLVHKADLLHNKRRDHRKRRRNKVACMLLWEGKCSHRDQYPSWSTDSKKINQMLKLVLKRG